MAYRGENAVHCRVRFDGTGTLAITDSYNISSVTDQGTGQYQPNLSTAFSNNGYTIFWAAGGGTGSVSDGCNIYGEESDHWHSEWGNGGTVYDFDKCHFGAVGDN
tara:strand:+ start:75 stop:389 length:315 start_codon:yes stop_codon:yes gene_type:complete